MRRISADFIYPVSASPVTHHVLILEDDGTIADLQPAENFEPSVVQKFEGALVPGFINAHCHLELSHLRGKFPEKTGLPEFLMNVMRTRENDTDAIVAAMENAEEEMFRNGIVAVGDISNNAISFPIKAKRKLFYHTFIELIGFDPFYAGKAMEGGEQLLSAARGFGLHASFAPHAPYSVSGELIRQINKHCFETGKPTSIHMLESNDENELYVQGTGGYRKLYRDLQIPVAFFEPTGKTSLESLLPFFNKEVKTLFVHNTIATAWDVEWAEDLHQKIFWCFCPNANLYIEDRLPDIPMLMKSVQYITIGTDSLSSNRGLSVLEELKTIQKKFPEIKTVDLVRWATLYGAKFLDIDYRYGSFEKGKKPGVNCITHLTQENALSEQSGVQRII